MLAKARIAREEKQNCQSHYQGEFTEPPYGGLFLNHFAILFNGPPKPEACWGWDKSEELMVAPKWPGFEPSFSYYRSSR